MHDGLGETLLYRGLALRLHAGHAVYGIEPRRRPDGGFAHTRVDEMAADYVGRIQTLRPHGPYLLAGLCAGGTLALRVRESNPGRLEVEVADTGPGIPREMLPRLFQPFASTKDTGLGLGLTISRRIVEDHGGTLDAENRPGGGASFFVRLPVGD